jgi:hypothetical protein
MVHDHVKGTWERLPLIDDPCFVGIVGWCQCVSLNWKLVLMKSVYDSLDTTLMKSVYIHDFESTRWSRGAVMPTARACFACCVSSSSRLLYVLGGISEHSNPLAVAEAYNVEIQVGNFASYDPIARLGMSWCYVNMMYHMLCLVLSYIICHFYLYHLYMMYHFDLFQFLEMYHFSNVIDLLAYLTFTCFSYI